MPYSLHKRKDGEEQPFWKCGPFKLRLPFIHYKLETVEAVQALVLFVVGLAMIPWLEKHLGLPFEAALAYTFVCSLAWLIPTFLGVPFVPGWITAAIPLIIMNLSQYGPGPDAIKALVAIQIMVAAIFLALGVTKLSSKIVTRIPVSIKAGILIGAGMAALMGEIAVGGRLAQDPISIGIAALICFYMLFSLSFKRLRQKYSIAAGIAKFGMVPAMLVAIAIGVGVGEFPVPNIEFGITRPDFALMWQYLPWTIGFPGIEFYINGFATAVAAYIIAFGDVIVGTSLVENANKESRRDEIVDTCADRIHLATGIRNMIHAFFAPYIGLAGPIYTAVTATVSDRYRNGRKAMDSIYGGMGTFWLVGLFAMFMLPLVTFFKPFLPISLALTMLVTGYLCLVDGFKTAKQPVQAGVACTMGVVLATHGAAYGLGVGILFHILLERKFLAQSHPEVAILAADKKIADFQEMEPLKKAS
ncbi:xanthine/uracil/vitamin C permease [Geoalkalibacter halelectricus]|uniref:xanthine/uracil/vitamin C permease n=1 Tax=Geoalkalibacter halelectricus TaxID=2847045 RepID=UPI003D190CB5